MKKKVIARLYIEKGSIEDFKKQAALIIQKTRQESGCLLYSLFQDVSAPGEFLFYEEYVDQGALDVHLHSEYLDVFRVNTKSMRFKDAVVDVI